MPATNRSAISRRAMTDRVVEWMYQSTEDDVALGDWSQTMEGTPISRHVLSGRVHSIDETLGQLAESEPTGPRPWGGTGRRIDYGVYRGNAQFVEGTNEFGLGDHTAVQYVLEWGTDSEATYHWPRFRSITMAGEALEESEVAEKFNRAFDRREFMRQLEEPNIDKAWAMLSDAAEDALCRDERGARRGRRRRPHQREGAGHRQVQNNDIAQGQFHRLLWQVDEHAKRPTPELEASIARRILAQRDRYPSWAENASSIDDLRKAILKTMEDYEAVKKRQRMENWRDTMAASSRERRRWVMKGEYLGIGKATESPHPAARAKRMYDKFCPIMHSDPMGSHLATPKGTGGMGPL